PMPCSSSAGSTTASRRGDATAHRRSRRRRDRRGTGASAVRPEPSAPVHIFLGIRCRLRTCSGGRVPGGFHAGPIRAKKDGRGGAALAAKRGERSKASLKGASREMVETMSEQQLREFASTKRRGLPRKRSG